MYFVYILSARSRNAIYVGMTNDLRSRLEQHHAKAINAHTKTYNIDLLVYFETHETLESAYTREKLLKRWKRVWKDELIETANPTWQDISDQIPL
jgi:putative endonuclease